MKRLVIPGRPSGTGSPPFRRAWSAEGDLAGRLVPARSRRGARLYRALSGRLDRPALDLGLDLRQLGLERRTHLATEVVVRGQRHAAVGEGAGGVGAGEGATGRGEDRGPH